MTLFQSQENVPKAIECGLEAQKIYEKLGNSLDIVANILIRLSELYLQNEGHKSDKARKCLADALAIKEAKLGSTHPQVADIHKMIKDLSIPPPPPLSTRPLIAPCAPVVEDIWEEDHRGDNTRNALFDSILSFGVKKAAAAAAAAPTKKPMFAAKKKAFDSAGWWKQNYNYAGEGAKRK